MRSEDSIGQPWGRGSMSLQSQQRARCHAQCHGDSLPAPSRSPQPGGSVPPPALTLCPAPSPQGFPPSQPLQPGGRESRAADGPRSPRPAESKVGTGLGARRRCARLALELRAPSSHRQLLGWGPLAVAPPTASPPLCKVLCGGRPGVSSLLLSLTLSSSSPRGHCQGWQSSLSLYPGLLHPYKSICLQRQGARESRVLEVFW